MRIKVKMEKTNSVSFWVRHTQRSMLLREGSLGEYEDGQNSIEKNSADK